MMAPVGGESPLDLQAVLATLEAKSSTGEQLLEAYTSLSGHLTEGELSIFERDIVEQGKRLLAVTKKHATGKGGVVDSVAQKALCVMGYCLNDKDIVSYLPGTEANELVTLLSEIITETKEKSTCSHALWCLGKQGVASDIISSELPSLLKAINKAASTWWGASAIVEHEGLVAINRLCDQCGSAMEKNCAEWGHLLLRLLVSAAPKVRNQAFDSVQKWAPVFAGNKECLRACTSVLKKFLEPELKKMFKNGMESYVLKTTNVLLQIFRQEFHHCNIINSLLSLLQLAFCCPSVDIRTQAFRSWRIVIDIFAEKNSLAEPKRVDLVMHLFKTNNTPTETAAMEKLVTWWYYVQCLGSRVWHHFDQILKPLLQFCLVNVHCSTAQGSTPAKPNTPSRAAPHVPSPAASRVSVKSSESSSNFPAMPEVQRCGFEILAHLLRDPSCPASPSLKFTLDPLDTDVSMSVGVFLKHATFLISALLELTKIHAGSIPEAQVMYVWKCTASHLRSALDTSRSERHEALSTFLGQFQVLVLSQVLPHHLTMKLFQIVCSFPPKVLSSRAFSIKSSDVVKGCPAQFLCEVLLTPTVLKEADTQESFMTLFSTLVRCGTAHPTGVLEFCQCVGDLLDHNAQFMSNAEVLWRLWSVVANTLQEHISKTNEVNQGDSLEYNFDCMYTTLLLPVTHRLGARVVQTVHKTAMKAWSELYRTFARQSAMVSNAEANIVLEEFSQKILKTVKAEDYSKDAATLEYLLELCPVMVDTVDFSSLTTANPFMMGIGASPAKKSRHRPNALGNLHSFVTLLAQLVEWVMAGEQDEGDQSAGDKQAINELSARLGPMCIIIIDTVSALVTRLSVSSLIGHLMEKLASPLASLFTAATKKTPAKLHLPAFSQKLERLWQEVCSMLQSRYKGPFDSDLLGHLAPLLQATFLHSRRSIKTQTALLWNATFGHHSAPLSYPADLQPVLSKVKVKTQLSLPGWINVDVAVIDETPVSQMSQMDSQVPDPVVPGMPSPVRLRGSFLHKDLSPKPSTTSPARRVQPGSENRLFGSGVRKKLAVDFMSDKDFVVIKEAPKKRRVLTEHQKEMMKEKRVHPAMYNNLDASQDISLMSHFSSSDTQQDSMPALSPTADIIVINSSQSQDLLNPVQGSAEHPSADTAQSDQLPTPRRSSRRRSVRFEGAGTPDLESRDSENSVCAADKLQGSGSASHKTALPEVENKISGSKSSSEETSQKSGRLTTSLNPPWPQPNVMAGGGEKLVDTLSSRDTSLSLKSVSSESSGGEEKCTKNVEESDPFFRPFKSLSQTLPRTASMGSEKSGVTSSEGSVRLMTRKTRSQEMAVLTSSTMGRDREVAGKSSSPPSMFTRLDRWLKKSPPADKPEETGKVLRSPDEANRPLKETRAHEKVSPPRSSATLVEETQSPTRHAGEMATANLSVKETPTKTSSSCSPVERSVASVFNLSVALKEAAADAGKATAAGEMSVVPHSLALTPPVPQQERFPEVDQAHNTRALPSLIPVEVDADMSAENDELNQEPPVLCDMASQGFSTELQNCPPPRLESLELRSAKRSEVVVVEDSVPDAHQDSACFDHQALFGFSELLKEKNEPTGSEPKNSESENEAASMEMSENLLTNTEAGGTEEYNPHLTGTLRLTPLNHRSAAISPAPDASDSSCSQQQHSTSSNSEVTPMSSQRSEQLDCEGSFDPASESTLGESTVHAKKRKQLTPKRIADPLLLRRTSRKKTEKKPLCDCCKDGPNIHHQNSPRDTRQQHRRSRNNRSPSQSPKQRRRRCSKGSASQSPPTVKSPVGKRTRRSLSQGADGSQSREGEIVVGGTGLDVELTGEAEEGAGDKRKDLSPQDMGEKTPEMKTNSTPLRHSTTKRKMEVARLRSMSLPLRTSLDDATKANFDLDSRPLSKPMLSMKLQKADVEMCDGVESKVQRMSDESAICTKVVKNSPCRKVTRSTSAEAPLRGGVSRLKLKKLARQKKDKFIRSPPKLRLRQRNGDKVSSHGKRENALSEQPGGKRLASSPPPVIDDVKETDAIDRLIVDPQPDGEAIVSERILTPGEQMMPRSERQGERRTKKNKERRTKHRSSSASSAQPGSSSSAGFSDASVPQGRRPVHFHGGKVVPRRIHGRRKQRAVLVNFERRRGRLRVRSAPARTSSENASEEVEIEQYESHQLSLDMVSQTKPDVGSADQAPPSANLAADAVEVLTDSHAAIHPVLLGEASADTDALKDFTAEKGEAGVCCDPDAGDVSNKSAVHADAGSVIAMETGMDGSEDMFEDGPGKDSLQMVDPTVGTGEAEHLAEPAAGKEDLEKQVAIPDDEKAAVGGSESAFQETERMPDGKDTKLCSGYGVGDELPGFLYQLKNVQDDVELMTAEDVLTKDSAVHVFPPGQAGGKQMMVEDVFTEDSATHLSSPSQAGVEQMTAEDVFTEDSATHLSSPSQAELELEEEELSPAAIFENNSAEKVVEAPCGKSGNEYVEAVLKKDGTAGDAGLPAEETAGSIEDAGTSQADQSAEKRHTAVQTLPESWEHRKLSKEEILNIIAESDVAPAEIIAALQTKTSKARRLFPSSSPVPNRRFKRPPYTSLPGRGMKMVEQSMLMQKQQQFGGYPTKTTGSQLDGENENLAGVTISVVSSPTTSPSGSILKRRGTLMPQEAEIPEDLSQTPTPIKKRRVSFADPIISGESPAHEATLSKVPGYFHKPDSARRLIAASQAAAAEEEETGSSSSGTSVLKDSASHSPSPLSQNSYRSTQESQLDAAGPIFPDLTDCDRDINLILPQLTSSLWHRGLCQLMKGRGVITIGNLASLSEVDVQSMPVRAPKVKTVKEALTNFHLQHCAKKSELIPAAAAVQHHDKEHDELQSGEASSSAQGQEGVESSN